MTRQRKIQLAVLGVLLVALAVDRLWVLGGNSGPDAAAAAVEDAAVEQAQAELWNEPARLERMQQMLERIDGSVADLEEEQGLAQRLARLAEAWSLDESAVANAFAVPEPWQPRMEEPGAMPDESTSVSAVEAFEQAHRLQAVMRRSDGTGLAIVNNQPVQVGERVGGFTLREVEEDRARFERAGEHAELGLDRGSAGGLLWGRDSEPGEQGQALELR